MDQWDRLEEFGGEVASALREAARIKDFGKGDFLISQDEEARHVWLILSGKTRAYRFSPAGSKVWIMEYGPADFFGEAAIFETYEADNVIALDDVTVAMIPAASFHEILAAHTAFNVTLSQRLFERWQMAAQRLYELSALSTPLRVNAELLRLIEPPEINEERRVIRPAPVLSELAERISATRESVSRIINALERDGKIIREPGAMVIRSTGLLEAEL